MQRVKLMAAVVLGTAAIATGACGGDDDGGQPAEEKEALPPVAVRRSS